MITEKQAKEFFVKVNCDTNSKEELAERLWDKMGADEREYAFRELEELEK